MTLTVTDNDGDTGSITKPVTVTNPPPEYALDAFGRTVANGLGTADIGGPWTLTGAASNFSVANGTGRIAGALSNDRAGYLNSVQQRNIDFTTDVTIDRAATGGGAYVSVIGRRVSQGNDYRLIVRYMAGGSVQVLVARTVGGTQTVLANVTPAGLTVVPGDVLRAAAGDQRHHADVHDRDGQGVARVEPGAGTVVVDGDRLDGRDPVTGRRGHAHLRLGFLDRHRTRAQHRQPASRAVGLTLSARTRLARLTARRYCICSSNGRVAALRG